MNEIPKLLIGRSNNPDELNCLESLTWMINRTANGNVPLDVTSILISTVASPIPKKDNSIRPLGLRDGYINLTTKCVLKKIQKETIRTFEGRNYALAGPKKLDELVALIRHAYISRPDHDRLFIDCTNAFNKVDRVEAAKAIVATCPILARYFYFLYQNNNNIWARENDNTWKTITGSQGGTQGCVLAPIVFGFGSLTPYTNIDEFLKSKDNGLFGGYLDDCSISAAHEDATTAFRMFQTDGPKHGLEINYGPNKTVVLLGKCTDLEETQQRIATWVGMGIPLSNIKIHPENDGPTEDYGYIHLGVPIGSNEYQHQHLHNLVDKYIEGCKCDEVVQNVQAKWVYLLWVIRQKFPFWFRHMCPSITSSVEGKIDTHMRSKFDMVLGQPTLDREWIQACLPTKAHGCGLGRPADIISAAFAANVEETTNAIRSKLPATSVYLDLLKAPNETFESYEFDSEDIKSFVRFAREKKEVIHQAAATLEELPILQGHDDAIHMTKKRPNTSTAILSIAVERKK